MHNNFIKTLLKWSFRIRPRLQSLGLSIRVLKMCVSRYSHVLKMCVSRYSRLNQPQLNHVFPDSSDTDDAEVNVTISPMTKLNQAVFATRQTSFNRSRPNHFIAIPVESQEVKDTASKIQVSVGEWWF